VSYQPIENHGIIGDLYTVALVGMDGSIDFMSFPYFDSPTIFAGLLDAANGGKFQIAPALEQAKHKQIYLPDSNVLISRFLSEQGMGEVTDFMPVERRGPVRHDLVRIAKTVRGEIHFRMICAPRFDYARAQHRVEMRGDREAVFQSLGPDRTALRLRSQVPMRIEGGDVIAEFVLRAGETASFVLEQALEGDASASASPEYAEASLQETARYWRRWIGRSNYRGRGARW
jgi:GH15 family glucan-1,4-alpha-glucosidase